MSKAEPIVVNPPKEIETPTFSKTEIVKIIRETDEADNYPEVIKLVNDGIEKGDIILPPEVKANVTPGAEVSRLNTLKVGDDDYQIPYPTQKLLGYNQITVSDDGEYHLECFFSNIASEDIFDGGLSLYIFTYANCFVIFPLSQTGEARVPANLVAEEDGTSYLGKLKATYDSQYESLHITTNITLNIVSENRPTAYLFKVRII